MTVDEMTLGALTIICACGWCYHYIAYVTRDEENKRLRQQLSTVTKWKRAERL